MQINELASFISDDKNLVSSSCCKCSATLNLHLDLASIRYLVYGSSANFLTLTAVGCVEYKCFTNSNIFFIKNFANSGQLTVPLNFYSLPSPSLPPLSPFMRPCLAARNGQTDRLRVICRLRPINGGMNTPSRLHQTPLKLNLPPLSPLHVSLSLVV